jgi:hypothetical protein
MGRPREEVGRGLAGTSGVGAGTVTGAGVGPRLQLHGIMDLIMEPAFNRNGRATDGSGSMYASKRARRIVEVGSGPLGGARQGDVLFPSASGRPGISKLADAGRRSRPSASKISGSIVGAILAVSLMAVDQGIGGMPTRHWLRFWTAISSFDIRIEGAEHPGLIVTKPKTSPSPGPRRECSIRPVVAYR